jgi:pilus assembly protein CpaB
VSITELAARLGGWPRRILALCCLLLAGVTAAGARHSQAAPTGHPVVVAARDLAAGAVLTAPDVRLRSWPDDLRPASALSHAVDAIGHRVAGAVRTGEALTSARMIGAGLATGLAPTLRAVPVQVSGPSFVHPGDSIDLLVSDTPDAAAGPPAAHLLVEDARVLAVTPGPSAAVAEQPDTLDIVVAVDRATSVKIAAVSGHALVAALRNPP